MPRIESRMPFPFASWKAPREISPAPAESHGIETRAILRSLGLLLGHLYPDCSRKPAQAGTAVHAQPASENSIAIFYVETVPSTGCDPTNGAQPRA